MNDLVKIEALLAKGWDLTVSRRNSGTYHATVHLGRVHGPDSHHCIDSSVLRVLARLEEYIDAPEEPSGRRGCGE